MSTRSKGEFSTLSNLVPLRSLNDNAQSSTEVNHTVDESVGTAGSVWQWLIGNQLDTVGTEGYEDEDNM